MRFSERSWLLLGVLVAVATAPREAGATPNFPGVVQQHLTLAAAPDCSLCHVGTPGRGTVNTPFGTTMRSRGLRAYDEGSLGTALDALAAEQKDSDGDGTADIRELRDATDPNAGAGGSDAPIPEYGCTTTRSGGSGRAGVPALPIAMAVLVLGALSRRSPRNPRAGSRRAPPTDT